MDSLTLITCLPLAGALLVMLVPASQDRAVRLIALATTLVVAVLGAKLHLDFDGSKSDMQYVVDHAWFTLPGSGIPIRFRMGVDGLSILMVGLTTYLMPLAVLSTWGHIHKRTKEFMMWMLVLETGMLGVFISTDLVLFYFFWEISLIPLYFMVGIWGHERRLYAAIKFFLYTFAGSVVMLIAAIALIYQTQTTEIERLCVLAPRLPLNTQMWIFGGFALAFAVKVPMLPFHTWLADMHTEAPSSGSANLAAVLLKMGTYGFLRFGIGMFTDAALELSPLFMGLGAAAIVYGAFLAMAQTDAKRLIACSSVSHMGFIVLGMFALTKAGISGSLLQMLNHGVSTGLLFLLIGVIYDRRHTHALDQFGGLAASMPRFALFWVFAVLSSAALPGLNGFVGEYLILLGTYQARPLWAIISVLGVVLGAVYLLMATRRMLYGPIVHEENRHLRDINLRESLVALPLMILALWIGVQPNHFLERSRGSLDALFVRIERARAVAHIERARADQTAALELELAPTEALVATESAR